MPNWNYNSVRIYAPIDKVKEYFMPVNRNEFAFDMHKLFPDKFPANDRAWEEKWDYNWAVQNTGSKWFPSVEIFDREQDDHITYLSYDSARTPNNQTLEQLHRKTGRMIINEYEEGGMSFEGTFECIDGDCSDDEREFQPSCDICEEKKPWDAYDEDAEDMICKQCRVERDHGYQP